jgi:uncharacterized membrane protein HdeD (DUF308 family)
VAGRGRIQVRLGIVRAVAIVDGEVGHPGPEPLGELRCRAGHVADHGIVRSPETRACREVGWWVVDLEAGLGHPSEMEPVPGGGMTNGETSSAQARAVVREVSSIWWIVLVVGITFAGFGFVMLFNVAAGATAIAIIVGAFLIFDGIVGLITAGQNGGSKALGSILGIVLIIGGIVVAAWPGVTFLVIAIVWGITIVVGGITRIVGSIALRGQGWGWVLAIGIAELIVGIAALVWPNVTAYVILLLIGIYAIVAGLLQIVLAFELKKVPERLGLDQSES